MLATAPLPRMKAIVQPRYGPPDVLQFQETGSPVSSDDGVLVKVRAASVNALDWHIMRGKPFPVRFLEGFRRPKHPVRGMDVAGIVQAVGKNVSRWKPGNEVFGTARGTFAEYATAPEGNFVAKPSNLTFEQAAAIPIAAFTALEALRDHGHVQPGQRVLINGAGGGVGTFAVQIAKSLGAHVTAVTSTRNVDLVRSIGAESIIDYEKEDFTRGADRYDALLDISRKHSFASCRRILKPEGVHVVVGGNGFGRAVLASIGSRFRRNRVVMFVAKGRDEDLTVLRTLVMTGKLAPVVDRRYPLSQVPDAIRYVETGQAQGKVVISVG